jgi:hypothetical protein
MPRGVYPRYRSPEEAAEARRMQKVRAWTYHVRAFSYDKIAKRMGISASFAWELVQEMREEIELPPEEAAVKVALARFEEVLVVLYRKLKVADEKTAPNLSRAIHENIRNQMALLGYAKPTRLQLMTNGDRDKVNEEYAELIAIEKARQMAEEESE